MADKEEAVQKMLNKAYAQMGKGSSEFINWYNGAMHTSWGLGTPWCAIFVCWCVYQGFGSNWKNYISPTAVATLPRDAVNAGKAEWVMEPGEHKCKVSPQPG